MYYLEMTKKCMGGLCNFCVNTRPFNIRDSASMAFGICRVSEVLADTDG
jgi:hypothetical protein